MIGATAAASRGMSRSTIWACSASVAVATTAGLPVADGVGDGGDEVGQGLAGAGAGLHEQVLVGLDRGLDRLGHRHLAGPLGAAHALDGGVQERIEIRGHGPKVKPGHGPAPPEPQASRAPPHGRALRRRTAKGTAVTAVPFVSGSQTA